MKPISYILATTFLSLLITGCNSGGSSETNSDSNIDNNNISKNEIDTKSIITGRVVDGEIKDATVFYDINKNGLLDSKEPFTKSDEEGKFTLTLSQKLAKNFTIPIASMGGTDIRTNTKFEQNLIAFREKESSNAVLTPLSTLIALDILDDEIDNEDIIFEKLEKAKQKYSEIFNINIDDINQDPIELAKNDNLELLEINMKINKVANEVKKALNDDFENGENSIKSFEVLSTTLSNQISTSKKSNDILVDALDDISVTNSDIFNKNKISLVKESTKTILDDFDKEWTENKNDILKDIKSVKKELTYLNIDLTPPTITLNGSNIINLKIGSKYQELGANAIDNKDGLIDIKIDNSKVKTDIEGKYNVIYTATDSSGNKATVLRIVNVISYPLITLNGLDKIDIILGNEYNEPGAKAVDEENNEINVTINSDKLDIGKIGSYNVIYNAKDAKGNESSIIRTVNVINPKIIINDFENVTTKCNSWNKIQIPNQDSFYTLSNNDWGRQYLNEDKDGIQCIFSFDDKNVTKGGWYWGWPSNNDYQVKGYPEGIYGAKFKNILNKNSGFPILVKDIDNVDVEIAYRDLNITKNYNIALEFWLHTDEKTSMDNIEYEIMFRFDPNGFHPHKTLIGEKDFGGIEFDIYKSDDYDGSTKRIFINFVAKEKVTDFKIDFKEALDYLTTIEFEDIPQRYMSGIEMGVEVIDGSGALILDKFEVGLNKTIVEELSVNQNFEKEYKVDGNYTLQNAPKGMRILNNGLLTWTPTPNQTGNLSVTVLKDGKDFDKIEFKINEDNTSINGYFIDPNLARNKDATGSEDDPFTTIIDACKVAKAGDNLYIRGGIYKPGNFLDGNITKGTFIRVNGCNGESNNNIIIRPWGNELVKILSDGYNAISVNDSSFVTIKDLEIEGVAKLITLEEALKNWWNGDKYYNGGGIAINKASEGITHDITVDGCIVHDVPAAGIKGYKATHIKIINNIVYNTNWWTVQGTTAVGVILAPNLEDEDEDTYYNQIKNNLLFGTQQRVFSRDWPKDHVSFVLDEGEALLVQEGNREVGDLNGDNRTGYNGRYLVKDNIVAYNGKGMVVNLADKVDILNNTIYKNGYIQSDTFSNHTSGGLNINASNDINLTNNIFDLDSDSVTIWYNSDASNIKKTNNYFKGYFLSENRIDYSGIIKYDTNATLVNEDFTSTIKGVGASLDIMNKAQKYDIFPKRLDYDINKTKTAQLILDAIPDDIKVVDINTSDTKYVRIYLKMPDNHPHTILTGSNDYVMEIPQTYASELTLPNIDQ